MPITREALTDYLNGPRFAFLNTADRSEMISGILAMVDLSIPDTAHSDRIKELLEAGGDAQDALALLSADVLNLAEHAGIIPAEPVSVADVVEQLKDFINDAVATAVATNTVPPRGGCPHALQTVTVDGQHLCQHCGANVSREVAERGVPDAVITPAAAPTPAAPTPVPLDQG